MERWNRSVEGRPHNRQRREWFEPGMEWAIAGGAANDGKSNNIIKVFCIFKFSKKGEDGRSVKPN